jgi:hypothetical protein
MRRVDWSYTSDIGWLMVKVCTAPSGGIMSMLFTGKSTWPPWVDAPPVLKRIMSTFGSGLIML